MNGRDGLSLDGRFDTLLWMDGRIKLILFSSGSRELAPSRDLVPAPPSADAPYRTRFPIERFAVAMAAQP
jgi:hypothetical protein